MQPESNPFSQERQSSEQFNHRLQMYSLAATATGVCLLALSQPARAEIVFTPANVSISARGLNSYSLDLNKDGTIDFLIRAAARESIDSSGGTSILWAHAEQGNGVVGYGGAASALPAGASIGSSRKFAGKAMASVFSFLGTEFRFNGKWANVSNRYLGLKFQINGEIHFGWARLTVGGNILGAHLTGYAYETVPNTPIIAGKVKSSDAASLIGPSFEGNHPATLGELALGAPALVRRRREVSVSQKTD